MKDGYILRAVDISKSYSGVRVLDKVFLELEGGQIHALMGENGAGKSTFMNILMGMIPPDEGSLYLYGNKMNFSSARHALQMGIAMIHQELLVFPELDLAENIFIGREPLTRWGRIDRRAMNDEAVMLLRQFKVNIPVNTKMKSLSIGEMQMIEIIKAVSNNAAILILDEPTSAISQKEAELLFRTLDTLRKQGKGIIYISHKMDEIFRLADRITVLRDGKHIATRPKDNLRMDELIRLMVGRPLSTLFNKRKSVPGELLLEVKDLATAGVKNASFTLRRGEILGIAGLMGAGRTEIAHALAGMEKITRGQIRFREKPVQINSPRAALALGIGLVTEDRKKYGLVLDASVKHNLTLSSLKKHSRGFLLHHSKENNVADREISRFRIKTSSRHQAVRQLSGGNQQKVVISGVHLNGPEVIILDEPTRGVDIGAKQEIYQYITTLVGEGRGVILISSELPEILRLSDRILVMREGKVEAELQGTEATQELIMKYAMPH